MLCKIQGSHTRQSPRILIFTGIAAAMLKYIVLTVLGFSAGMHTLCGQTYKPDHITPVSQYGVTLVSPFAGGLNDPQFSATDLNHDGLKDLFIFDRTGNKVLTFINTGSPGVSSYVYWPEYESIFPPMKDWAVLLDYNCDGLEDILTGYDNGVKTYKASFDGYSNSYTEDVSKLQFHEAGFTFDLVIGFIDVPGFADVNSDGDIDVLTFNSSSGNTVEYYENQQVENGEDCGVWDLDYINGCWGNFFESGLMKTDELGYTCKGNTLHTEDDHHTGSTFMVFDEDDDTDVDIVLGDLAFSNLDRLVNGGNKDYANMVAQDTAYPSYTIPLNMPIFPAPYLVDVNNDGHKDMLVAPNNLTQAMNYKNVWYYKNTSTDATYHFSYQTDSFLVGQMVDVGQGSYPAFFDYNNDGLPDLVIGNHGYYDDGGYDGMLALYENTGTAANPAFTLVARDFDGISAYGFHDLAPTFADLDGDGDQDMLLGEEGGGLEYFTNIAPPGGDAEFVLGAANYQGIDVGANSTPQLFDVDGDGLPDFIIGEQNGNLNYYHNTGTATAPVFTFVSDFWGNVDVRAEGSFTGYSAPFLYKKGDGTVTLYSGCEDGTIYAYQPTPDFTGSFTLLTSAFNGIDEGSFSSLQFADITGDNIPELITGNYRGGISLYRDASTLGTVQEIPYAPAVSLYPNPATEALFVHSDVPGNIRILSVIDMTGRELLRIQMNGETCRIDLSALPAGLYFLRCTGIEGEVISVKKFVKT